MRIAIAYWQGRVSPVFDVSDHLLLIDLDFKDGLGQHRDTTTMTKQDPFERAKEVAGFGVDTLLCGAISRVMETALADAGVQVFSFICGDLETILNAFLMGELSDNRFLMPGCRRKRKSPRFNRGGITDRSSPGKQTPSAGRGPEPGIRTGIKRRKTGAQNHSEQNKKGRESVHD